MKRIYAVVLGQVQGVGFRIFLKMLADKYNCSGWVRNMENGCVEFELQTKDENINNILKAIIKGNSFIKVEEYQLKEITIKEDEKEFKII
ncbi:MAG: acylphosphatase [Anaerorhabdus sp.]